MPRGTHSSEIGGKERGALARAMEKGEREKEEKERSENALKKIFPREAIKRERRQTGAFLELARLAAKCHPCVTLP